jgi:putative ABC transport system substrate-binding protein
MVLLGGAGIARLGAARAQQRPMPVIGLLSSFSREPNPLGSGSLSQGLGETGYVYGKNVAIEYR